MTTSEIGEWYSYIMIVVVSTLCGLLFAAWLYDEWLGRHDE